uniref:Ig-like domain-containing protein n=1 Tax=Electrophorus electricus TaxID=8005 RepID=A0A4W4E305_ELEEL
MVSFTLRGDQPFNLNISYSLMLDFKLVGPAAPVVAVAGEDLVLPCSIHPRVSAEDMRVEWNRLYMRQTLVHLYVEYEDRNDEQIESYRGRTELFKEELHKGNISVKLSAVQPSDEGVYNCAAGSMSWYDDITVYVEVRGKSFHNFSLLILLMNCLFATNALVLNL